MAGWKAHLNGGLRDIKSINTGWWFGTFFPYIGNVIIPTDEIIFFRGFKPPTKIGGLRCVLHCNGGKIEVIPVGVLIRSADGRNTESPVLRNTVGVQGKHTQRCGKPMVFPRKIAA